MLEDLGDAPPQRNTLLLQLFFGRELGPAWCRDRLLAVRKQVEEQRCEFDDIADEMMAEPQYADHHVYWKLTLDYGRTMADAHLAWIDDSIAALSAEDD